MCLSVLKGECVCGGGGRGVGVLTDPYKLPPTNTPGRTYLAPAWPCLRRWLPPLAAPDRICCTGAEGQRGGGGGRGRGRGWERERGLRTILECEREQERGRGEDKVKINAYIHVHMQMSI